MGNTLRYEEMMRYLVDFYGTYGLLSVFLRMWVSGRICWLEIPFYIVVSAPVFKIHGSPGEGGSE